MDTPATASDPRLDALWNAAQDWPAWLETVQDKRDLWDANRRRARVRPAEAARLSALPGSRRVLVLTEDWCGDAARSVPVIAKALADAPQVEARYLSLDEQPDAIARHLTHGGRAIPIAIVLDEHGRELGAWGPRPAPLQALFRERRREQGAPTAETLAAFYAPVMAWYGRDEGVTTLQELLVLLERGGAPR
jgi:hypothetical protein